MNGEIRKISLLLFVPQDFMTFTLKVHLTSPCKEPPHHLHPLKTGSVCNGGEAKNGCAIATTQTIPRTLCRDFSFQTEKLWRCGFCPKWGRGSGGVGAEGGVMFRLPQCSESCGLKENPAAAVALGTAVEETLIPCPPIQEGRHRSSTAEGVGGGVSASSGVVSPPQPPPFRRLVSYVCWSSSSSNFFFPPILQVVVLTSGHKAPPMGRSVRRVHGAVTSLLLLLLLQEELLQRRRARLHHRARPDGLQGEVTT